MIEGDGWIDDSAVPKLAALYAFAARLSTADGERERSRRPSTAPSDLAQQRDAEDVLQQKRDGADG